MSKQFEHEPDARRYVLRVDGTLVAVVDYSLSPSSISFTRTFTNPQFRGKGYAAEIVKFAVDNVEATSARSIVPMCWYVSEWFEKNPERTPLLSR